MLFVFFEFICPGIVVFREMSVDHELSRVTQTGIGVRWGKLFILGLSERGRCFYYYYYIGARIGFLSRFSRRNAPVFDLNLDEYLLFLSNITNALVVACTTTTFSPTIRGRLVAPNHRGLVSYAVMRTPASIPSHA